MLQSSAFTRDSVNNVRQEARCPIWTATCKAEITADNVQSNLIFIKFKIFIGITNYKLSKQSLHYSDEKLFSQEKFWRLKENKQ